jgi:hypothetical protein
MNTQLTTGRREERRVAEIETDYLVVGAGAAGMAFVDALIAESDSDVVMVDRRHCPGGHWNDAYPFVRLHQASANYGVNSRALGADLVDATGPNAGFYERATGVEICGYFRRALDEHLLPSGKVRFLGMHDYVGDWSGEHALTSRLSGKTIVMRVRRKVVDGTYLETSVPATHRPRFTVDPDARLVPVGDLVEVAEGPSGYTILGAGKTAMDACNWLLDGGVDPGRIRWVRPRDAWLMDRASVQPLDLVASTVDGFSLAVEALAQADNAEDLFRRLEACGQLARLDGTVEPSMFRGAILSDREREGLQQIDRVVRQGRVVHLGADRIVMEDGTIPTDRAELHVDCTAYGFRTASACPIFEPGRITLQSLMGGFTTFNAALVGFVEAARDDDTEKNRLCPPTPQPSQATDWIRLIGGALRVFAVHSAEPDLMAWLERSRLSLTRGMGNHLGDPRMQSALARWAENGEAAMKNAERLLVESAAQH